MHRTLGAMDWGATAYGSQAHLLFIQGVNVTPWPPPSLDFNSIGYVWNIMEKKISTLHHFPQTMPQLIDEVQIV